MRFVGIFDKELPDLSTLSYGDLLLIKQSSPVTDVYKVFYVVKNYGGEDLLYPFYSLHSENGTVTVFKKSTANAEKGTVIGMSCFAKYRSGKSFTRRFNCVEDAIDFVVKNFLTHSFPTDLMHLDVREYKGGKYFSFSKDGSGYNGYYSGELKPNGRLYLKDYFGKAVISGTKVGNDVDLKDYLQSLCALKKAA